MRHRDQLKTVRRDIVAKLAAFFFYKEEGLETVVQEYPEQLEFIRANASRSFREVQEELLHCLNSWKDKAESNSAAEDPEGFCPPPTSGTDKE